MKANLCETSESGRKERSTKLINDIKYNGIKFSLAISNLLFLLDITTLLSIDMYKINDAIRVNKMIYIL